jgi:hypothetical protein
MKHYAVFQKMPSGGTICHFRGKKGGCDDVASRDKARYTKHLLDCDDVEKSALTHFVAFTLKDPNDTNAAKKAVEQIYTSLRSA